MKRAALLASLLLAAAGCAAESEGLEAVQADAIVARANLVNAVFLSKQTFTIRAHDGNLVQARVKLSLVRANDFEVDGEYFESNQTGRDFEVIVEDIVEGTGERYDHDSTFLARRNDDGTYIFMDCGSTRNCATGWSAKMTVTEGAAGLSVTVENRNIYLAATDATVIEFEER